ncbi:capsid protein [Crucivirus-111]|nr:capsid protein [Crucivirus-111]
MPRYTDAEKAAYYKRKSQTVYHRRPVRKTRSSGSKTRYGKRYLKEQPDYRYPGVGRRIGGYLGSMAGNVLAPGVGGAVGNVVGSLAGQGAQALIKKISGFGDYSVSKNSLMYNVDAVPEFSNNNERCTVVTHREFISDIQSSTGFVSRTFRINPALAETFPWLAALAENYEQYVVQGMVFEYKTTSATAIGSTNTSLGTVVMATQYNSLAPPFSNKQQMENYEFSQSTVPSQSILHPIECDPMQTQCGGIFNMFNPNDTAGDTRLYDIGRFTIATVGMQAGAATVGELWVSYKICLLKPRLQAISNVADGYILEASSVTNALPLGNFLNATTFAENSNFTNLVSSSEFRFDPNFVGVVQVLLCYVCSGTAITPPTISPLANCVQMNPNYINSNLTLTGQNDLTAGVSPHNVYSLGFFNVTGGFNAGGSRPGVSIFGLTTTGVTFISARILFISVPSQFTPGFN